MLRAVHRTTSITRSTTQQRRAFLNLVKFSSTAPRESETQTYHERKILPFRRNELYRVIADVESYPSFVPYCTGSRVLESRVSQDGVTVMETELTVGFLALRESYVSVVMCKPYESVEAVVSPSTHLFKSLTTTWRLQPMSPPHSPSAVSRTDLDHGPTLVTLDLAFAFTDPVHATVSATFFGQVSKLMVRAFEERCAALYCR